MAFDVLPRNVGEAAEDPVAVGGGLAEYVNLEVLMKEKRRVPRDGWDRTHAYGTAAVRVSQVAAGGLPAHAWGRGACDRGAAVLRRVRQGSWREHVFPRRMACGDEYALSYVAYYLSPYCSAAGGRHGDDILRVGEFTSGCETFEPFYRFLCFAPWARGA